MPDAADDWTKYYSRKKYPLKVEGHSLENALLAGKKFMKRFDEPKRRRSHG